MRCAADAIEAVIADELGSLDVLDDFVARDGRPRARALPIGRVCIVSSRTTIGVAIVPAIFALCAKCDVARQGSRRSSRRGVFRHRRGAAPALRGAATARPGPAKATRRILRYDAVVAFGDDAHAGEDRDRAALQRRRFIAYGSKASAGYVTREALRDEDAAREIARGAARDLTLYETEGCLSLHALFVESGGAVGAERFAELLEEAMRAAARRVRSLRPMRKRRRAARWRASSPRSAGGGAHLRRLRAGYLVVLDPPHDEPPLFLARAIGVRSRRRRRRARPNISNATASRSKHSPSPAERARRRAISPFASEPRASRPLARCRRRRLERFTEAGRASPSSSAGSVDET